MLLLNLGEGCPDGLPGNNSCLVAQGLPIVLLGKGDGQTRLKTIKDEEHMRMPCNFHTQGAWMVCPDLDSQVCILDREHKVVAQLGDGKPENGDVGSRRSQLRPQFTPGKFITLHDAIFLHNGNILVAEWLPIGRLTLCAGLNGAPDGRSLLIRDQRWA